MTDLHFGPTGNFEALTDEAAGRFDRRVLKKIEASDVMLERIRVDPFLRDAHVVLKATTDVDARKAAKPRTCRRPPSRTHGSTSWPVTGRNGCWNSRRCGSPCCAAR
jgi:hypothetical protein